MTTEALAAAGLDPTGYVGARVTAWGGNLRAGGGERFVVEADEYDRSFLALAPTVAVVTNVEADHLDIYADLDDMQRHLRAVRARRALRRALRRRRRGEPRSPTPPHGRGDPLRPHVARRAPVARRTCAARRLGTTLHRRLRRQAAGRRRRSRCRASTTCATRSPRSPWGSASASRCRRWRPGIAAFRGVERRFQRLGEAAGALVVDDYAHHPTEVRATLAGGARRVRRSAASSSPSSRTSTRARATSRASSRDALAAADAVYLLDIYPAREQPIAGVTSDLIAERDAHARARTSVAGRARRARGRAGRRRSRRATS